MRKYMILTAAFLALLCLLCACGDRSSEPTEAPAAETTQPAPTTEQTQPEHWPMAPMEWESRLGDLICIDGDFFDEDTDLAMLEPLVSGLVDIAPTFYVTGNHEWQVENLHGILRHLEQLGAIVLENEYHTLERDGQKLVIAGVHDPCGPYDQLQPSELVAQIRAAEGEEVCIIMLAHRNDTLPMWAELQVDLVLTGHCHGGVIRLPLLGGVFGTKRELFPEYDAGLYERGQTQLYVSRGLGYTNTRLRLFNRPHLPILVLRS